MIILVQSGVCIHICTSIYVYNSHSVKQLLRSPLDEEHLKEGASAAGAERAPKDREWRNSLMLTHVPNINSVSQLFLWKFF